MKFTIPEAVLTLEDVSIEAMLENIRKFDDITIHNNVIYALVTDSQEVKERYEAIAD